MILALRANTLKLRHSGPAGHLDVTHSTIGAQMPRDREVIDNANGRRLFISYANAPSCISFLI